MIAKRAFPLLDDNGQGVRRARPGENFAATESEAEAFEAAGKAYRTDAAPRAKQEVE